jgi:hypothetical protein
MVDVMPGIPPGGRTPSIADVPSPRFGIGRRPHVEVGPADHPPYARGHLEFAALVILVPQPGGRVERDVESALGVHDPAELAIAVEHVVVAGVTRPDDATGDPFRYANRSGVDGE